MYTNAKRLSPVSSKTKPAGSKTKKDDFESAFRGLREMMKPCDKKLWVTKDKPGEYMSESKSLRYLGKPLMFASITTKSYVAFHLFPVYMFPNLLDGISPELKKRMQGKTCWNFKKAEEPLFEELGKVVEASLRRFEEMGKRDLNREDAQALWGKGK
jgi:hypothetical protein